MGLAGYKRQLTFGVVNRVERTHFVRSSTHYRIKWAWPDSNRRFPPCRGDVIYGPLLDSH